MNVVDFVFFFFFPKRLLILEGKKFHTPHFRLLCIASIRRSLLSCCFIFLCLFLALAIGQAIFCLRISKWISQCISACYHMANKPLPSILKLRLHPLRASGTSYFLKFIIQLLGIISLLVFPRAVTLSLLQDQTPKLAVTVFVATVSLLHVGCYQSSERVLAQTHLKNYEQLLTVTQVESTNNSAFLFWAGFFVCFQQTSSSRI